MDGFVGWINSLAASPDTALVLYGIAAVLAYLECAAFVGLLMPGESFVSFAGFLASRGVLNLWTLFPIVIVSAFLGDVSGYLLGRKLGESFLETTHRFLKVPRPLIVSARDFFRRHGGKTVFIGRFIGFLRAMAPFLAGASRTGFGSFIVYDALGAIAWTTSFLCLGYFLGEGYRMAARAIGHGGMVIILAVAGFWAAAILLRRYRMNLSTLRFMLRKEVIFSGWFLAGATLLLALVEDVAEKETMAFDRNFLLMIHRLANPMLDRLMRLFTSFGSIPVIAAIVLVTGVVLWNRKRRFQAAVFAGATLSGILMGTLFKIGVRRPRPELWPLQIKVPEFSFPSGHTVASAMAFWFLAWMIYREVRGFKGMFLGIAAGAVPLLVGFTRLYLGVHWPTDILGGFALAFAVLAPWLYIYELNRERYAAPPGPEGPPDDSPLDVPAGW